MLEQLANTIEEYQQLRKSIAEMDQQFRELRAQASDLEARKRAMAKQAREIRALIDYCVETGEDPVAAKLSHTVDQMQNAVDSSKVDYTGSSISLSDVLVTPNHWTTSVISHVNSTTNSLIPTNSGLHSHVSITG